MGDMPSLPLLFFCILFTFLWAQIAAKIATRVSLPLLNRLTGIILTILGLVLLKIDFL